MTSGAGVLRHRCPPPWLDLGDLGMGAVSPGLFLMSTAELRTADACGSQLRTNRRPSSSEPPMLGTSDARNLRFSEPLVLGISGARNLWFSEPPDAEPPDATLEEMALAHPSPSPNHSEQRVRERQRRR